MLFSTGVGPFPCAVPERRHHRTPASTPLSIEGIINIAYHTVLPATALAAVYLADYSLIMRASMVDELGQDYLTTARAKGLMDHADPAPARGAERVAAHHHAHLPELRLHHRRSHHGGNRVLLSRTRVADSRGD